MASSQWAVYDQTELKLGKKLEDFINDSFKVALFTSASNVGSNPLATPTYGAATNEVAAVNGYSTGGVAVTVTWTNSGGTITFGSTNPTWTPTGSGIVARFAVLYDVTTGDLICWILLDTTPADVNVQQITISGSGVFTLARG